MKGYHLAADNPDLVSFLALIRGERGYPDLWESRCDLTCQVIAVSWEDEAGWNFIAFSEKGRRMRKKINDALGPDQAA